MKQIILSCLFTLFISPPTWSVVERSSEFELNNIKNVMKLTKIEVVSRLAKLTPQHISEIENKNYQKFLNENLDSIIKDVSHQKIKYVQKNVEEQSTCLLTHAKQGADIILNVTACKGISFDTAFKLLVHEAIHHMGVTDEYFAYGLSNLVFKIVRKIPFSNIKLHCKDKYNGDWFKQEIFLVKIPGEELMTSIYIDREMDGPVVLGISDSNVEAIDKISDDRHPNFSGKKMTAFDFSETKSNGSEIHGTIHRYKFLGSEEKGYFAYVSLHCFSKKCEILRNSPGFPITSYNWYFYGHEMSCKEF